MKVFLQYFLKIKNKGPHICGPLLLKQSNINAKKTPHAHRINS